MTQIDGGLRSLFHTNLRAGHHWQAVETGGTGLGIPDSNYCCKGVEGWVEYKLTDAWSVGLSAEQIGWHQVRAARGGRTFVAVRRRHEGGPRKGVGVDELWLYEGRVVAALGRSGLRCNDGLILRTEGGPARWDWASVAQALQGVLQ